MSGNETEVAVLVPLSFFLCLLAAVGLTLYFRYARERQRHETLRKMVEKGMEIPPDLLVPPIRAASDLRRGLVLLGAGIGLLVLLITFPDRDVRDLWAVGLIPILMGAAYLATWRIRLKDQKPEADMARLA
jgi:hypothetical protein